MGNVVHKFQFADHNRTLKEIKSYYDKLLSSLEYQYSKNRNVEYDIVFSGMTEEDVETELENLKEELSIEGAFELLAFLEKEFRTDCYIRCTKRYRDDLSKAFKDVYKSVKKVQFKIGFLDVIVEEWKKKFLSEDPHNQNILDLFSEINDKFGFRNWIAHGRYWAFPYQRGKHNFDAVWLMVNAVETVIGAQFYRYEPIGEKI